MHVHGYQNFGNAPPPPPPPNHTQIHHYHEFGFDLQGGKTRQSGEEKKVYKMDWCLPTFIPICMILLIPDIVVIVVWIRGRRKKGNPVDF